MYNTNDAGFIFQIDLLYIYIDSIDKFIIAPVKRTPRHFPALIIVYPVESHFPNHQR
jgi:hypothetical protein